MKYYCWKDGSNDLVGNEKEIDLLLVIFVGNSIGNLIGKIDDLVGNEREIDLLLVIFVGNLIGKVDDLVGNEREIFFIGHLLILLLAI